MKAAIKGYRIAIKTGTAKKVGPDGRYINKYIAYTAGVAPASQPLVSFQRLSGSSKTSNVPIERSK